MQVCMFEQMLWIPVGLKNEKQDKRVLRHTQPTAGSLRTDLGVAVQGFRALSMF